MRACVTNGVKQSHETVSINNIIMFEEKVEPKWRIEPRSVLPLTSRALYHWAKPAHFGVLRRIEFLKQWARLLLSEHPPIKLILDDPTLKPGVYG